MAASAGPRRANSSINHCGTSVACTPCRRIKMKCIVNTDSSQCNRCLRKNIGCFFESHRRGRRVGAKVTAVISPGLNEELVERSSVGRQPEASFPSSRNDAQLSPDVEASPRNDKPSPYSQEAGASLAPAGLLHSEAITGEFSLKNVFRVPGSATPAMKQRASSSSSDPTRLNIVSIPIARNLFDSFINYLNPYVVHLDPLLHTFDLVQRRSSFLLTVILCTAARIFNESVHGVLQQHADKLLAKFLVSCEKSTESIQAILILTYWKDPSDSRAWHFVGHAIRMATAMNWHKFESEAAFGSEMEIREQRNKERTWLILFVYDRSLSLQLGRPWMQHVDRFISNANDWHKRPYAVPENDLVLTSFLQLRMIGAANLDFWPSASSTNNATLERVLDGYFTELEMWELSWCEDRQQVSRPADFMIKFYGAHFRLLLSSSRLQLAQLQCSRDMDECVQSCLTSGDYIFRVLLDKLGPHQQLYYVQDSIHVMIAYTTILLIKILLSMQEHVTPALERAIVGTILEASGVFGSHLRSSCTDQASFLKRTAEEYRRWKKHWQSGMPETTSRQGAPETIDAHQSTSQNHLMIPENDPRYLQIDSNTIAAHSDLAMLANAAEYNHNNIASVDFSSNHSWGNFLGATGFEFDNWSLLNLSAAREE